MIVPLYIYTYNDPVTCTNYGKLSLSLIKEDAKPTSKNGYWALTSMLYVIANTINPLPLGTNIISVVNACYFPYDTTFVQIEYDPFQPTSTIFPYAANTTFSFAAYTQPVPHTQKLYIYPKGSALDTKYSHYYPTLSSQPPFITKAAPIVLYVFDTPFPLFQCLNSRVIPSLTAMHAQPLETILDQCHRQKPFTITDYSTQTL